MFDIITFGSATRDIIVSPKKVTGLKYEKHEKMQEICFPLGSKIDVEHIYFTTGGGGTNVAATFAKQGVKTAFCGAIGTDLSGQEVLNELRSLGINTKFVVRKSQKPTNHSIVVLNSGVDRTILAYRGAAELLTQEEIPFRRLKAKWIYVAPLSGLLCESFKEIINWAVKNKIKIAANPGMAQLSMPDFPEIAKHIDILILNQEEASFLTKIPFENKNEIFAAMDVMCPGILVMTRGGSGVSVSDGKHLYSALPPSERIIADTTGAGDAFGSGFVVEFIKNNDIEKAMQFGMANSVGCISEIGAKNGLLKKGQSFMRVSVTKQECDNNVCSVK